ncbi:MAG: hypothetical protein GF308_13760 [Candidatus Heimdallarchaeota archaeon]|nr:hypothetical protein [Candidatus Heimdallarchaeota archaeon]
MAEMNKLDEEVSQLRTEIDTILAIQKHIIKANSSLLRSFILREIFGIGKGVRIKKSRIKIYLAINGELTVNEVADSLGMHLPNVSREITPLKEAGLIEIAQEETRGIIYSKTYLDSFLNLSGKIGEKSKMTIEKFLRK